LVFSNTLRIPIRFVLFRRATQELLSAAYTNLA